jgi:hypothetical protein
MKNLVDKLSDKSGLLNQPDLTNLVVPDMVQYDLASWISAGSANLPVPDLTNLAVPDLTNLAVPDLTDLAVPDLTDLAVPDLTDLAVPDLTNLPVPDLTNLPVPDLTSLAVPDLSEADLFSAFFGGAESAPIERQLSDFLREFDCQDDAQPFVAPLETSQASIVQTEQFDGMGSWEIVEEQVGPTMFTDVTSAAHLRTAQGPVMPAPTEADRHLLEQPYKKKDSKKAAERRERNRESAKRSRDNKRSEMELLKQILQCAQQKNTSLKQRLGIVPTSIPLQTAGMPSPSLTPGFEQSARVKDDRTGLTLADWRERRRLRNQASAAASRQRKALEEQHCTTQLAEIQKENAALEAQLSLQVSNPRQNVTPFFRM